MGVYKTGPSSYTLPVRQHATCRLSVKALRDKEDKIRPKDALEFLLTGPMVFTVGCILLRRHLVGEDIL